MITAKQIMDSLSVPNDYYDRCYMCNRLGTNGYGDMQCSDCQLETFQNFVDLGVVFDDDGTMHKI